MADQLGFDTELTDGQSYVTDNILHWKYEQCCHTQLIYYLECKCINIVSAKVVPYYRLANYYNIIMIFGHYL